MRYNTASNCDISKIAFRSEICEAMSVSEILLKWVSLTRNQWDLSGMQIAQLPSL